MPILLGIHKKPGPLGAEQWHTDFEEDNVNPKDTSLRCWCDLQRVNVKRRVLLQLF